MSVALLGFAAPWALAACAEGASIGDTSSASSTSGGGADTGGGAPGSGGAPSSSSPATTTSGASTASVGEGGASSTSTGEGGASTSTASSGATTSTGGHGDQLCNDGEYVTDVDATGLITCAPFGAAAQSALASSCRVYLGWADGCGACTTAPTKWGYATTAQCANGAGLDNTCVPVTLGATTTQLFGLSTGGDVDENDKFYGSLHCGLGDATTSNGPCAPGTFASGVSGGVVTCTPASGLALGYARESCHLYMGWQDGCGGCTTSPTKWGYVNDGGCVTGAGVNDTCTVATLGGETVQLLGINTGGDVNDDDKFYWGFRCDEPAPATSATEAACPAGQLVHGIQSDGTLFCEAPDAHVQATFRDRCTLYAGWIDSCTGCTSAPTKWGAVRTNSCVNGAGLDDTCGMFSLGGQTVQLFGLNTDGDVNDDDKFHVAFKCE